MLEQFFECRPKLVKQIAGKIKEPSTREDILQEVFLKFAAKLETIEHRDNLCGYLYRITENTIADHYRRETRLLVTDDERLFDQAAPDPPVDDNYRLANCCLRSFIDRLPPKYREALILIELEGKSQKEAAVTLGVSYSGLKSRVQRGREKLKEAILACCRFEFDKYGNIVGRSDQTG